MSPERRERLLMRAGAAVMAAFCLGPFLYMFAVSLSPAPDLRGAWTLANYRAVLGTPSLHFRDYLVNSMAVSALSALFTVAIASLAAYAITRLEMAGKAAVLFFVLAVSMFPQVSLIGYLFRLMSDLGLINTYAALVAPYVAWILPLSLWILVSYFAQIPKELDRAAVIDGCSPFGTLWRVLLPVALPGVLSTALLSFIFAFNEFIFALILTTDHAARTIPVGIAMFQGLHGEIPWGNIMAASALSTAPVLALTAFFQRHIIQGLTRGAVKG
ncbi:MAG: carbohydrate ABC transporter permease [Elusimicrobia bacterium]|nr:carbohydrate ABC transporter permease [Elusimicrobiota bacterium]